MIRRHNVHWLAGALLGIFLVGCNGSNQPLPPGTEITISPANKSWEVTELLDGDGNCQYFEDYYNDETVVISVTDSEGRPLGDVDVSLALDLSGNTFSGTPVLKLYADSNSNGVADDPGEWVSDNTDALYRTKTGRYNGEVRVIVRMNLSCHYRGNLTVVTEGYSGVAEFSVVAVSQTTEVVE